MKQWKDIAKHIANLTSNPEVAGSTPVRRTKKSELFQLFEATHFSIYYYKNIEVVFIWILYICFTFYCYVCILKIHS